MSAFRALLAAAAALCVAASAPAAQQQQQLRGTVIDSIAGAPAAFVTVVLVDDAGAVVARGLSSSEGRFALTAPPGRYRLRALRVGYEPVVSEPLELAAGAAPAAELRLAMRGVPVNLAAVRVTGRARCIVRPGPGTAAFAVWEEARKALEATALGQSQGLVRMTVAEAVRDWDPAMTRRRREDRSERSGVSANPYPAPPPEELAEHGYVRSVGPNQVMYHAPDARVLLSDPFFRDHCIRPVRSSDRPGMIGLAFEPVRTITHPDVRGTLWLDERSAELRFLEFGYTSLPNAYNFRALGGRVDFMRLPAGQWVIRRWIVRAPVVESERKALGGYAHVPGAGPPSASAGMVVTGIREAEGEVVEAASLDGRLLWGARRGTVVGVVTDSAGAPVPGASVFVAAGGAAAVTDDAGRYRLEGVPSGRQTLRWSMPAALATSGALSGPAVFVSGDSATAAPPIVLPGIAEVRGALCAGSGRSPDAKRSGVLVGIVRDSAAGQPARGAPVDLQWETADSARAGDDGRPRMTTEQLRVRTDSLGWFRACGLPHGVPVHARASLGERRAAAPPVTLSPRAVGRRDVAVPE